MLGVLVTLTSVGAGAIGVAVLTGLYPALLARRVVGTDIVHAIPLTLVSGLGHAGMGHVNVWLLAALLAGSVPGILIGSRITGRDPRLAAARRARPGAALGGLPALVQDLDHDRFGPYFAPIVAPPIRRGVNRYAQKKSEA